MSTTQKVSISLKRELLKRIDRESTADKEASRSSTITSAVNNWYTLHDLAECQSGEPKSAAEMFQALENWYTILGQAKIRMRSQFSAEEKGLILDATNGSYIRDMFNASLIWANIDDAIRRDQLDKKWKVDNPDVLVRKMRNLSPYECVAMAEAIREWWENETYRNDRDTGDLFGKDEDD